jgi:predicted dienelactone hydrolase
MRKLVSSMLVIGAVMIGLSAQAGAYLLDFTSPAVDAGGGAGGDALFSSPGPHPVGMQWAGADTQIPVVYWYPAIPADEHRVGTTYAFAMNMLGPDITTALATFDGRASVGAPPDLSAGPYPLVILSHGFAITASSYGWLAEQLASYGLVVVAPAHDESLDPSSLWQSTIQRPRDVAAAVADIDRRSAGGGELEGLVDVHRTAVIGHSYGGYTAQVVGGARLDTAAMGGTCESAAPEDPILFLCDALIPHLDELAQEAGLPSVPTGLWPDWSLAGVDAVVSMAGDAVMFGPEGLAEVEVPVLTIGGTADTDSPYEWGTGYTFDNASSDHRIEVGLEGAGHMIFAGRCEGSRRIIDLVSLGFCSDAGWDRDEAHQMIGHYVTAFLLGELTDSQAARAVLAPADQVFPNVDYRAEGY